MSLRAYAFFLLATILPAAPMALPPACISSSQSHLPPAQPTGVASRPPNAAQPVQQDGTESRQDSSSHMIEIDGQVEDNRGQPVPSAMLEIHSWSGSLLATQVTNSIGAFTFHVNGGGPYVVRVTTAAGTESIQIGDANLDDVVIRLEGNGMAPAAGAVGSKTPTVSLNDLQASNKARSKLANAQKAMGKSDLAKAWQLVNEAIAAAPNWGRAHLLRGVLSMQARNYTAARTDLNVAVQADPNDALALTELGKLYSTTGDLTLSGTYLHRALEITPVLWPTYVEMSGLDLKQGNFTDAKKMADNALYADPPAPASAHFLAGEAADRLGDAKTAIAEYRSFVALQPATPEAASSLAAARRRIATLSSTAPHIP